MSSVAKSVPGDIYFYDLTMKKTTTAKLLLTYLKTLLKQINFAKQTRAKLAGNAVSSPSVAATRIVLSYRCYIEGSFVSSVGLRSKVRVSGKFRISLDIKPEFVKDSNEIPDSSHP